MKPFSQLPVLNKDSVTLKDKFRILTSNFSKMIFLVLLLVLVHCLATCFSIVLLGDKGLMGHNLFKPANMVALLFNWRFILAMSLAILARVSFVLINSTLLKIPSLAGAATTITVFVTAISILFVLTANYFFLNEVLSLKQAIGAVFVIVGICIMLSK